jgi:hypothetical protein
MIFLLINLLALAPVTGANDSNDAAPVREANRQDTAPYTPKAEKTFLAQAMHHILRDDALGVKEGSLSFCETNAMPQLIYPVLAGIPFKAIIHIQ